MRSPRPIGGAGASGERRCQEKQHSQNRRERFGGHRKSPGGVGAGAGVTTPGALGTH